MSTPDGFGSVRMFGHVVKSRWSSGGYIRHGFLLAFVNKVTSVLFRFIERYLLASSL